MIDYWFDRMRQVGFDAVNFSAGLLMPAICARDVRAVRNYIAKIRFVLARMEDMCYKIEQEQAEEVM